MLKSHAGTSSLRAATVPQSRDCTKSTLESILYANVARVFAKTDAFAAAIARNRPWGAFCLQTWQEEEGIPSGGLVHPRTRVGGGAR